MDCCKSKEHTGKRQGMNTHKDQSSDKNTDNARTMVYLFLFALILFGVSAVQAVQIQDLSVQDISIRSAQRAEATVPQASAPTMVGGC